MAGRCRMFVGNTHGSSRVNRHFGWSQPCRLEAVNPSPKLRRFESFTCHRVHKGPLTSRNAGQGPSRGFRLSFPPSEATAEEFQREQVMMQNYGPWCGSRNTVKLGFKAVSLVACLVLDG